ncbi:DUF6301 family protein [Nocardia goodfellowii]|uniref:Uncharacterized protein n=1 Tax=Nocardia goodfellowii TaxID=882446 RepID=A0ABS4QM68_9NOCA|nr:DUF6301 family protein [Nocardia goodfellowii]MBP2192129.1 hypothetical protein [Nocardia goodfellowii]
MRVDLDRATQAVRVATEFDWTWTIEDLPGFTERLGWQLSDIDQLAPKITTDFDINRTDATAFLDRVGQHGAARALDAIWFYASDVVLDDPSVEPAMSEAFEELAQRVFEAVGQRPTGAWTKPTRGLRWDLRQVAIKIATDGEAVEVRLISPAHQAWNDENDRQLEEEQDLDSGTGRVWHFD